MTYKYGTAEKSLNPCSNGICSQSIITVERIFKAKGVLILVLMEYALRGLLMLFFPKRMAVSLNPCSNGICSQSDR